MDNTMSDFEWKAVYNDGTFLKQVENGVKHAYADIDRSKLTSFELWKGNLKIISIPFTPTQRLIWRRRTEFSPGRREVCHIIGKQETLGGENRQIVFAVFESDGHVELSDRFDETHSWFFPVQIHTEEGEVENGR